MKKVLLFFIVTALFLTSPLNAYAERQVSAEAVSEVIRRAAPVDFGYVDNTEYAMQHDFAELSYVDDSCIVVCAESTNFNEFGVFHVENTSDVRLCEKYLKSYLAKRKSQFQNGVIYDIAEYPKFENAKVLVADHYIIYVILDAAQGKAAGDAIKQFVK